jgi:replicative DNA helicase
MTKQEIPYNVEAESAVLGALLIDPKSIGRIEFLEEDHFYIQKHRWVYAVIRDLHTRGMPIDFVTLTTELNKRGQLEAAGGSVYISQLVNSVPSAINIESYAHIVMDAWRRRQMLDVVSDVARLAHKQDEDIQSAAAYIQSRMAELLTTSQPRQYQAFDELAATIPEIEWLWQSWIPRGMLTLLGATPGAGKSMIALDLSRRVIHAKPFPNGAPNPCVDGAPVIYIDAEVVPQIIKERVERWEMDASRLFLMLPRPNDMIDFSRIEYQEQLRNMVASIKPALIIVDSLSSITSKGENSIEDVRAILGFLNELANTHNVAVLIIHHLRKRSGAQMALPGFELGIDDFRGSSHITAMARSIMALSVVQTGPEHDPNGPRKLSVVKSNLCRIPDAIGCEMVPLHPAGVMLRWDSVAPEPYKAPTKQDECTNWLRNLLRESSNPLKPKEIVQEGRNEGFSRPLIYRARKELGRHVQDTTGRRDPNNKWEWVEG